MAKQEVKLSAKNFNSEWVKGIKKPEFVEASKHLGSKEDLEAIYDHIKGVKKDS